MMPFWNSKKHAKATTGKDDTTTDAAHTQSAGTRRGTRKAVAGFLRSMKRGRRSRADQDEQKHQPSTNGRVHSIPSFPSKTSPVSPSMLGGSTLRSTQKSSEKAETPDSGRPHKPPTPPKDEAKDGKPDHTFGEEDVKSLYYGAPQFGATTSSRRNNPRVAFPWDKAAGLGHGRDYQVLQHPSFTAATVEQAQDETAAKNSAGTYHLEQEIPSMLSLTGSEPGTVGIDYFLGLNTANAIAATSEEEVGVLDATRNFEMFHTYPEKLGIRAPDTTMVNERLVELSELQDWILDDTSTKRTLLDIPSAGELYATLFGKFLMPPRFDANTLDPTGLQVQIESLIKALTLKGIWFDFSRDEQRIVLGQLLWNTSDIDNAQVPSDEFADDFPPLTNRDLLLLQITLACELYLRLDAITAMDDEQIQEFHLSADDARAFNDLRTPKIDWDLILARRFLNEVKVIEEEAPPTPQPRKRSILSALSISSEPESIPPRKLKITFGPRNQTRQLNGLGFFAGAMDWPNLHVLTELGSKLGVEHGPTSPISRENDIPWNTEVTTPTSIATSIYATPLATPRSTSNRSSYFGTPPQERPGLSRDGTQRSYKLQLLPTTATPSAIPQHLGGWVSRAWFTGLILPGEAISLLLMSTLLENDALAVEAIGDYAMLDGGFVYAGCSYWSKNSIVGRVLAATAGARDCMGWVSVKSTPELWGEEWVRISSEPVKIPNRLRDDKLAKGGNFIRGTTTLSDMKASYLSLPSEAQALHKDHDIQYLGLVLEPASAAEATDGDTETETDSQMTPTRPPSESSSIGKFTASLRFSIPTTASSPDEDINPDLVDHGDAADPLTDRYGPSICVVPLRGESWFVSAWGCAAPPTSKIALSAEGNGDEGATKKEQLPSHPLHKSHAYATVPVSSLLESDDAEEILSKEKVCVITLPDVRDAEVLARAWCSSKGYHALVARQGTTCLSCAVREADALGVKVVIRILME